VVTEYHYHASDHFSIDVDWFSAEELRAHLEELLGSYRQFHLRGHEMEREERRDFGEKADLAIDTFHAMFRHAELEDFLVDQPEAQVLDTFMVWAGRACPSLNGDAPPVLRLATSDQCSKELMRLTSELDGAEESAQWPFVKKIR